jgi:hypothetical protein
MSNPLDLIPRVHAVINAYAQGDVQMLLEEDALASAKRLYEVLVEIPEAETMMRAAWVLAWFHWYRHQSLPSGENEDDLNRSVTMFTALASMGHEPIPQSVRLIIDGEHDHPDVRMMHFAALLRRYRQTGDETAFSQAVGLASVAIEGSSVADPKKHQYQWELGSAWVERFHRNGKPENLERAIPPMREAAGTLLRGHPLRADFAGVLLRSDRLLGRSEHVNEAILLFKEVVDAARDDHAVAPHLMQLCTAFWHRYHFSKAPTDLDEAIDFGRRGVAAADVDDPSQPEWMANLASTLIDRYQDARDPEDLDEAERLSRAALARTSADDSNRARYLFGHGNILWCRHAESGEQASLDEAVKLHRAAVAASNHSDPDFVGYRLGLAIFLGARSSRFGQPADLDEAIRIVRAVSDFHSASGIVQGRTLNVYSALLHQRYELVGERADLDEAVSVLSAAVDRLEEDNPTRATCLFRLGRCLRARYLYLHEPSDLDLAIHNLELAAAATPAHVPELPERLVNLGLVYKLRFEVSGDAAELDRAVDCNRRALELAEVLNSKQSDCQYYLGDALLQRFRASRSEGDLDEAAALLNRSLGDAPHSGFRRLGVLLILADLAQLEFESSGEARFLDRVVDLASEAAAITSASASHRINAAKRAAFAAVRKAQVEGAEPEAGYRVALPLIRTAFELLPLLVQPGLPLADGYHLLDEALPPFGGNAAACAAGLGQAALALQFVEESRGVIWGQLLDLRTDLTDLHSVHPELASAIDRSRTLLDRSILSVEGFDGTARAQAQRETRVDAARRFDTLVATVRSLPPSPEFPRPQDFLRPPPIETLLPPEGTGPVVTLTVSRWECLALIAESSGVYSVGLPVTSDEIYDQVNRYLFAIQTDGLTPTAVQEAVTSEILAWAWEAIAAPVLDRLGYTYPVEGPLPRIWWCPTGPLALLPIHAAGHHAENDGRSVLDRAVSSYTPTLRVLTEARAQTESRGEGKLLITAIAQTPGKAGEAEFHELKGVRAERRFLEQLLGGGRVTSLIDVAATRTAIVAGLREHRWAHLACHGIQDPGFPANAGLVPYDWERQGLIDVRTLGGQDSGGGEFAFLSACQTAIGGTIGTDEAISLASAMQYAGWKHVVGTLWSVHDGGAAAVTALLYSRIIRDGRIDPVDTARALHDAVRTLRDEAPAHPSHWARFIHMGP